MRGSELYNSLNDIVKLTHHHIFACSAWEQMRLRMIGHQRIVRAPSGLSGARRIEASRRCGLFQNLNSRSQEAQFCLKRDNAADVELVGHDAPRIAPQHSKPYIPFNTKGNGMGYVDLNCFSQRSEAVLAFLAIGFAASTVAAMASVVLAPLFRKA